MAAQFIDLNNPPGGFGPLRIKKLLYTSDSYHVWLHLDEPGDIGPMHNHTEDETFFCLTGECTIHFVDGTKGVLTPGVIVIIPKGEFYQLENTGTGMMVLLGNRGEGSGKPRFDPAGQTVTESEGHPLYTSSV